MHPCFHWQWPILFQKRHYPQKLPPLKLLTKKSAKVDYLLNQAKIISPTQKTECIKVVDMEEVNNAELGMITQ